MKVLVLGGTGMLGSKLWQVFSPQFDTYVTMRQSLEASGLADFFDPRRTIEGIRAEEFDSVIRALGQVRPEVVVNCIGIVKQHHLAKDALVSITVNALFPHRLAHLCQASGCRLIHVSTDCVFSGNKGNYVESDPTDAEDLYGRTKALGEVDYPGCLTVRTSIIGRELGSAHGLIEWFLRQEGKTIRGYKNAIFSGLTTRALADIFAEIIRNHADLRGVWHVAAEPVSKYDLLSLVKETYRLNVNIEPDETFRCNRSLNGKRFEEATKLTAPPWPVMVQQMCA
ncbi:MAG: NAD(P)-dependent oxidoreductase [Gemmatales bacterium]|nr:MAG: NAD(P)-dependent oxidoreductase [Gemmatales bacterium]